MFSVDHMAVFRDRWFVLSQQPESERFLYVVLGATKSETND